MQIEDKQVADLFQQAQNYLKQIEKKSIQQLMAFHKLPMQMSFVFKVFYALIANKDLDQVNQFNKIITPSQPKVFQQRKLTYAIMKLFLGYDSTISVYQISSQYNPALISDDSQKYIERLRIQYLQGNQPLIDLSKLQNISYVASHLWKWSTNMLLIRQKLKKTNQ